ncbi:Aste57867_15495 [Aphanomyces stellatus]|uniref:Ubiquitin carboxyl-terminal hydrolase n=1 Tax=Aphanomyces stellatus TaxID=120398 RepID=A0A485L3V0_9STRA|nr:hypothetical protein As57867_015439 [Aphanomyces stellatus]VFT92297.1 Aste57867_15495 [Aphanomyces stellatus]
MAKTAALSLPSTSWQNQVVNQPPSSSSSLSATSIGAASAGLPLYNNNGDGSTATDEDMLQKMERMVSNRPRLRKSTNIDTSSSSTSSSSGGSGRFNARLLQRGPSGIAARNVAAVSQRESPRLQPLGNQPSGSPSDEASLKRTCSTALVDDDDDGASLVQLPPASSSTSSAAMSYPGSKELRRDAIPTDKLDAITITARAPKDTPASIVVLGKSLSCKGTVGLQNLGNTCFMNSCLQCLSNVASVMHYFRHNLHLNELNETSPTHGKLACVFGDLVQALWTGAEFSSTRPVELKRVVGKLASRFIGYDQHDAQEFLRFLLDGLHEDLNRIRKKPPYYEIPDRPSALERDVSDEYWQYYVKRNWSALSEQFCGQLRSEVICQTCNHRSICFDVFWDLSLPVPKKAKGGAIRFGAFKSQDDDGLGNTTVQDCLRAYTEEEHMKEDDAFYCSKCKVHRSVVKKISLQRCPNVLVLHLKRFSYSTFSRDKVSTAVKFPTEGLDLKEYCSLDNGYYDKCWEYDLIGMIHHMGSLNGGHYTAECRNPENGNWYDFNDETVSALKKPHAASSSAYILFYQRRLDNVK